MSSKPTVTLTLAGDEEKLTQAFDRVGAASQSMASQVEDAGADMRETGARFDDLADSTDTAETRFTGFYDTIGGTRDALAALNDDSLSTTDRLVALGQAGADLAGGLTGFVVPALKGLWVTMSTSVIPSIWAFTSALLANPITWIVVGIIALVAVIVLMITHWDKVKQVVGSTIGWIRDRWNDLMGWFGGVPDWFGRIFSGIGSAISGAFKGAINWVIDRLNWLVDRANDLIYGINVVSPLGDIGYIPHIPRMHTGGIVPGMPGTEVPIIALAGERVTANGQSGPGGGGVLVLGGNVDSAMGTAIDALFRAGEITWVPST